MKRNWSDKAFEPQPDEYAVHRIFVPLDFKPLTSGSCGTLENDEQTESTMTYRSPPQ